MIRIRKTIALCLLAALGTACAGSLAAELPAGTVIDKDNLDKIKGDTFDGHTIASLLTEKLEWQIRNTGLKIPLAHAKPVQLDPKYLEATRKNAGKAQFDEKTREVTGWEAGIPFPQVSQNDPFAGDKLIWNFYYASPEGDVINNKVTFLMISGDKGLESTQDWVFQRYYMKGRLSGDKPVLGDGSVLSKTLFAATAPEDIRGLGTFTIRYDSPKLEDSWAYIKSARRTRRLSGGAWMDPVGGLDVLNDDIYVWNARPSWYPKIKLLGKRWILASSDAKLGYTPSKKGTPDEWKTVDLKNPPYWNPVQTWQPREVWVIEGTPPNEHPYGKKVVYMDVNYPRVYMGEAYDKKGEFWKFINFHMTPSTGEDGTKYSSSIQGDIIDFKARHASIYLFRGYKLNEARIKEADMTYTALESIAK
ncbi:DUF1329 domain-containing protein [Cupriavidus sp. MP-37]|uniref:DUF1329 domain-containing protein n=1 Tax=Cupriavidus sp. MP-37 TaxID=2884455 RepID=UPI001D09FDA3|nr:DUF1329 domain-containing protein [Cupriavidus sp. MP-37]UDM49995.1 DUF1329 domain-containing protein [Cupriavidus sp. MP-37]